MWGVLALNTVGTTVGTSHTTVSTPRQAEWRALPGNTTQDVAENDVYAAGYDVVTVIQVLANNASAITVKVYDISTTNQKEVLRSLAHAAYTQDRQHTCL